MPKKKSRRPSSPQLEDSDDGNDEFLVDPEQIFDVLPQPFRMIDKTVNYIFDRVWSIIEGIEDHKAAKLSKESLPIYDCGRPLFDIVNPSCMCGDNNGKYLFVAHDEGFSVVEALIGQSLAFYEDSSAKSVTQMNACCLQEGFYLLATLDTNGVAKLFCYSGDLLQLAKVFTDESSKQAVVSTVHLSDDANYVGIGWETKESWLEVYKIPKESWAKEAESSLVNSKSKKPDLQDLQGDDGEAVKGAEQQEEGSMHSSQNVCFHLSFFIEFLFTFFIYSFVSSVCLFDLNALFFVLFPHFLFVGLFVCSFVCSLFHLLICLLIFV